MEGKVKDQFIRWNTKLLNRMNESLKKRNLTMTIIENGAQAAHEQNSWGKVEFHRLVFDTDIALPKIKTDPNLTPEKASVGEDYGIPGISIVPKTSLGSVDI